MADAHLMLPTRVNLRAELSGIDSQIANSNKTNTQDLLWQIWIEVKYRFKTVCPVAYGPHIGHTERFDR